MVKCCEELNCLMAIVTNCMLTLHILTMMGGGVGGGGLKKLPAATAAKCIVLY